MAFRIEIHSQVPDARSVSKRAFFNGLIGQNRVSKVIVVDAYSIDAKLNQTQITKAAELLTNPVIESFQILNTKSKIQNTKFDYAIEISFLPGVTDNVGHTAKESLTDALNYKFKPNETVYSSKVFLIFGKLHSNDIKKITEALHNPLIQKAQSKTFSEYKKSKGFGPNLPKVNMNFNARADRVDLYHSDENLWLLGKLGIENKDGSRRGPLALSVSELKAIRDYFHKKGRQPTDVEVEALAQTWSEHCQHAIFNDPLDEIKDGIFRHYIKRATNIIRKQRGKTDFCVSVFKDNAGGIIFDENFFITFKVETHNTPSSLDPFGGSLTGILGVNRDALGFGLGSKPIVNTFGFCLASPDDKTKLYRDQALSQPMLSARRIMDGVISGINAGGNQSGIPTNSGFMYFDSRYRGKPLVFAGTVGLIPRKIKGKPSHVKQAHNGDLIVMIGGRVGLDGIHGATFSSEGLSKDSPATAVQIGDPITQKKFSDAIAKEARNLGLYNSITDCGAGGLSSAVGEMAKESNGCFVQLDKVPIKYPGLAPWQIWISESQERMVLAVPPEHWRELEKLMKKRGVESTVIGKFTKDGKCTVKFKSQIVMDISLDFLHNGRPIKYQLSSRGKPMHRLSKTTINLSRAAMGDEKAKNLKSSILNLLKRPNIASREFLARQYDHEVQGGSVAKPIQGKGRVDAGATISRPVLNSQKGVVLSFGLYPGYSELDPYKMSAASIDTAIRSAVCAGARLDHLALLDNFCWCEGHEPYRLWQLNQAARACFDYATAFGTPFISGKDSMFNDFKGFGRQGNPLTISIPPTLLISAMGVVEDIAKAVTLDAKMPGDIVYLLGETKNELQGSEYGRMNYESGILNYELGGKVPTVDAAKNLKLYRALEKAVNHNLVASAIPLTQGGLAAALFKTAIAGQLGAEIAIKNRLEPEVFLFSESQGRALVTIDPRKAKKFEKLMRGNTIYKAGVVTEQKTIILRAPSETIDIPLADASRAYRSTFKNF